MKADIDGINAGTIRAVSDDASVENFLAQSAEWRRTDGQTIPRSKWRRVNHVCEQFDELRGDLNIAKLRIAAMDQEIEGYFVRALRSQDEIAWLRRPLWVKVVGWFAR